MFQILFPFHGSVLNHRDGTQSDNDLEIEVSGIAPLMGQVTVNGMSCRRSGKLFYCRTKLSHFKNDITAIWTGPEGHCEHAVSVVWDKYSKRRYRVAIDDNIYFLRDLFRKNPRSIFDSHYLAILKRLHDEFGTKFNCNLFNSTPERDFSLEMMPDRWKEQFADNADWLRFSWHAENEFPAMPYMLADAETITRDYDMIHEQIVRFAGETAYCPASIVHWGEVPPSCLPVLYERGVRTLSGYFKLKEQRYYVSYGLDEKRSQYVSNHDALYDFESGMTFSRLDIVVNHIKVENIESVLQSSINDVDSGEIIDMLTHEPYMWPFYREYQPEHEQRLYTALKFVTDRGYEPVWMHEGFMGVDKLEDKK